MKLLPAYAKWETFAKWDACRNSMDSMAVRLAINRRRGIIATHTLKLPGKEEDRSMYFRLASIIDSEVPLNQRVRNFWMGATVHSEGKRLNMAQTNAWVSALHGVVGERSLKRKYPAAVAAKLGISGENVIQHDMRDSLEKTKENNSQRKQKPEYIQRRKATKIAAATRVAKEGKKKTAYRSKKVKLSDVAKLTSSSESPKKK